MVGLVTKPTFRVVLLTPRAKLLDCRAGSVIIPCSDGQRGILRNHCPLLTGLELGIMEVQGIPDRQSAYFVVEGGFARFSENNLTVLAYDAVTFENLDDDKIKQIISQAQGVVAGQEYIKTQLQKVNMARSRLILRMAQLAGKLEPVK
ncbi:MAG TPA: ATP synthase F1 subunit epsilon [Anaerohalosphaeraceae bacterium]|nr:ATP synthase F1 subunit epsilon [Anaerohalosphaeraceae bacterium]